MNALMDFHGSMEVLMVRKLIPIRVIQSRTSCLNPKAFPRLSQMSPLLYQGSSSRKGTASAPSVTPAWNRSDCPLRSKCGLSVWQLQFPQVSSSETWGLSHHLCIRILGSASPRRPVLTTTVDSKQGSLLGSVPNQPTLTPTLPRRRELDFGRIVFAQV